MTGLLDLALSREFVVALAVFGALVSTFGSYLLHRGAAWWRGRARLMLHGGYAITGISVLAFIVAGFLGDS